MVQTLCWTCRNAYANRCCWMRNCTPVEGWVVKYAPVMFKVGRVYYTPSYLVQECPNYAVDMRL